MLCISPVFRDRFAGEIKLFLRRGLWKPGAADAGHCTYAKTSKFALPQQILTAKTYQIIMQCSINLGSFLPVFDKCRFTKVFSLFSTVFVDNFVENAPTTGIAALDKLYYRLNIGKNNRE